MAGLRAIEPGPLTTLQDLGRRGYQRFGVTPAGAMDPPLLVALNAVLGNPAGMAALEFTLLGGRWEAVDEPVRIAFVGENFGATLDGRPLDPLETRLLEPGMTLAIAGGGVRGYLGVEGGFDLAPVLGSLSSHLRSSLGEPAMQRGRILPAFPAAAGAERRLDPSCLPARRERFRVILGPQDDFFTAAGIATLLGENFTVTGEADRMGYRLAGPRIEHRVGYNIISDGISIGTIQVPGDGLPIVLLADRQSTGGYPKIACVITADLPSLAQRRPGDIIRFEATDIATAQAAARELAALLAGLPARVTPVAAGWDSRSEALLGVNLIDGVVG